MIKEEDSCFSSSSSDESELSNDEEETDIFTLYAILMMGNTRGVNIPCEKLTGYAERVMPGYSRQQFKEHFRSIYVQFGVRKTTAFRTVRRITYALHCLAVRFIQRPKGDVLNRTIEEFLKVRDFPNVIGALDGSYIKIRALKEDAASYMYRKRFHAIHL
ncbi:nuclease harbi1 [Lasius niger]|uniref:Nuclease harbi1 n=1 Tax=Lasius niger TaxID=67767 RepID=A0A0J7K642_LASNI|nr:nuclease harbi1 [Lasius niger]